MWKIKIEYDDKSSTTLEGKHKDIPLELAIKYFNQYAAGRMVKSTYQRYRFYKLFLLITKKGVKSTYQRYPKKEYDEIGLYEKIEELMAEGEED